MRFCPRCRQVLFDTFANVDLCPDCGQRTRQVKEEYTIIELPYLLFNLRLYPRPFDPEADPISYMTAWRWVQAGKFPNAHKIKTRRGQGGAWVIPFADILAFSRSLVKRRVV